MLKKTIKYTNFNDVECEKECWFGLSESELIEMNYSEEGGLQDYIKRIQEEKDEKKMYEFFKELTLKAYGEVSEDGEMFVKDIAITKKFAQTAAFNAMFVELATDSDKAIEFVTGIMPKKMQADIKKQMAENPELQGQK